MTSHVDPFKHHFLHRSTQLPSCVETSSSVSATTNPIQYQSSIEQSSQENKIENPAKKPRLSPSKELAKISLNPFQRQIFDICSKLLHLQITEMTETKKNTFDQCQKDRMKQTKKEQKRKKEEETRLKESETLQRRVQILNDSDLLMRIANQIIISSSGLRNNPPPMPLSIAGVVVAGAFVKNYMKDFLQKESSPRIEKVSGENFFGSLLHKIQKVAPTGMTWGAYLAAGWLPSPNISLFLEMNASSILVEMTKHLLSYQQYQNKAQLAKSEGESIKNRYQMEKIKDRLQQLIGGLSGQLKTLAALTENCSKHEADLARIQSEQINHAKG